ncbi:MAG: molybdopterin-dependent oxidoreductase [Deltaproteobacteria bacterium]|nr:molybdopterin-dependent oxidoreductase [Deltaproteobacteria bacterium]
MKKVSLKINGKQYEFDVDPDKVLLDLLREDLRLTGAKQSCDRKAQCGACTVIVNKKAVKSCVTKVTKLEGADVITIEGLGTPDNPHLIQEAFVLSGAIQCGFCTPGMIMATKVLLDNNPDPTDDDIKKALAGNLCRCTGYKKIFDAVKLSAEFLRGEKTPDQVRPDPNGPKLGVSHPRPSSMIKACGLAKFGADIYPDNALELAVVRSTEEHAKIVSIDTSVADKMPGVAGTMTAKDIKGTNRIQFIFNDQVVLCDTKVRNLGDPIAIVAAETQKQARAAAEAVKVEYEKLPVLKTVEEAMARDDVRVHDEFPNLVYQQPSIKGDAAKAFEEAAAVVECDFSTQMNHQAPLEGETTVAWLEGEEDPVLVVSGRSIMIHTHMGALQGALGYENMRYEEPFSGGQFGIKASITSEGISGAAALHFKRAVRYIPGLHESMLLSPKRHPFKMKVKLAADKDGNLTAYGNDFIVNNGAYMLLGIIVVGRAIEMFSGAYSIPNIDAMGKLVYTNDAAGGAARGAGPPQVNFALECAMDMLAEKIGMDPLEFRIKNSLKPGDSLSTGIVLIDDSTFPQVCELIRPHYERAKKDAAGHKEGKIRRGVGLGAHSFGIGMPSDMGVAVVELNEDDGITVYTAAADPGEGNDSMFTQLAAHMLDIPLDKVRLVTRTTENTSETGPAASSRITYMVGGAMVNGIEEMKAAMKEAGTSTYEGLKKAGKQTRYIGRKTTKEADLDPETGQGAAYETQVHNIQMAEVEVNTETGEVRVIKMTTSVDPGPVIHPINLEGQLEGGMDQGVGYALREEYIHGETKDWKTFKFPTFNTYFDMEIIPPLETPRKKGALGSIGVGEMTMVSTAPAVINAIKDACGVWIKDLPATPDKVLAALAAKK